MAFLAAILLMAAFAPPGAAATPRQGGDVTPYIIGGHPASEPYPGMASLQVEIPGDPDYHICGAILVSGYYIVTNAHCVTDWNGDPIKPEYFHLRIGSHDRLSGGRVVGVTKVLPHADWDWATGDDPVADIAMLRLDTYVMDGNPSLQPFTIAPRLADRSAITRILGWGVTEPSGEGPLPRTLQELDTKVVSPLQCAAAGITAGEICIDDPHGTDGSCYGDSGGPALQKVTSNRWSVVGGTSRGTSFECGTGKTVYTDITYYRTWVYTVMRTGTVPTSATGGRAAAIHINLDKWRITALKRR